MTKKQDGEATKIHGLFCKLEKEKFYLFPEIGQQVEASKKRGVYIIANSNETVLHVGSTPFAKNGIRQRLLDHLAGRSSFVRNYLNGDGEKLRSGYQFKCLEVPKAKERALLEACAIGRLCPCHIGHGIDQEAMPYNRVHCNQSVNP